MVAQEGIDALALLLHLLLAQTLLTHTGPAAILGIVNAHRRSTATHGYGIEHRIGGTPSLPLVLLHAEDDGGSHGGGTAYCPTAGQSGERRGSPCRRAAPGAQQADRLGRQYGGFILQRQHDAVAEIQLQIDRQVTPHGITDQMVTRPGILQSGSVPSSFSTSISLRSPSIRAESCSLFAISLPVFPS